MWIETSAPSNIALIKYMGKTDAISNRPINVSISYTLDELKTYVRMQKVESLTADTWAAYIRADLMPIQLSEKGTRKFISFFQLLKKEFRLQGFYQIESANNFPSDCGLASSASSFAALTKCAHEVYLNLGQSTAIKVNPYTTKELSKFSQKGSGSSCRSFFSPWGLWHESGAEEIKLSLADLKHMVILCDESIKRVSSSDAHTKVLTSDLFKGRPERASLRFQELVSALRKTDASQTQWKNIFGICWNEFWDMHTLFHTAKPPFMYMNGNSQKALVDILSFWEKSDDGPLVTMDAGSNIHLLFRNNQSDLYEHYMNYFIKTSNLWAKNGYQKRK
ncbi:MAG: diphosphomevalonate decarboxylase [Bdellovibrionaceae bacterium]|nr:diphosphomevalonate decarboxylase [Pseudobdellovibrionaceae bacterium]